MMSLAIGLNLLPLFLTSLSRAFGGPAGLSQEQLGRLGALNFSGLVVGILAAGPLADRYGSKGFTLAGNGVIAASLIGMSVAPTYAAFCAATFCLGLGAGTLDLVLSPIVAALNPHRRSAAMNWLHSFYCVGAVATVLAGALALRAGLDWHNNSIFVIYSLWSRRPTPVGTARLLVLPGPGPSPPSAAPRLCPRTAARCALK